MQFTKLFENSTLQNILHDSFTTTNFLTFQKEETTDFKDTSFLIIMDFIIKYGIIINDDSYNDYFITRLQNITKTYTNYQSLILAFNNILIDIIANKLKIEKTNEKEILDYIYNVYIVNGYCFHSFPSSLKSRVEEEGLTSKVNYKEIKLLKQINYIFNNHHYKNIIPKNLNSKSNAIYITDSPYLAYYYAIRSPYSLASLTSLSKYYNYLKDYDKNAYYNKDYTACKDNLEKLCTHVNMTFKEKSSVLKAFDKMFKTLKIETSTPTIAFIKRKDLGKDYLEDIASIKKLVGKEDLNILISRITDSKYTTIRRFTDIPSLDLKIKTFPSYQSLKKSNQEVEINKESKKQEDSPIEITTNYSYSYGKVSILFLLGLFLIFLGLTISIILKYVS